MENKLKVDHDAGFFSCCTVRLQRIVEFYNKNKFFPVVESSNQWSFYKDKPGDVTSFFFKNVDFEEHINEEINHTLDHELSPYNTLDFKNIKVIIDKYFKTSEFVEQIYNKLVVKYNIDLSKTISVCYRGNDKQKETNLPTHSEMILKISEVKNRFPDHTLLVQSDEVDFYESVLQVFPEAVYFKEVFKIRKNDFSAVQYSVPVGHRTEQAIIFLAIMKIISESSKVIINSGNVGMWVTLFRGSFENVYQYLNHREYIYGHKDERFDPVKKDFWIENQ